jgi:tetratricopeptide (TPR) repeat protein
MPKTDANDYSRFQDIDEGSDEDVNMKKGDEMTESSGKSIVERVALAKKYKDVGNEYFKNNDLKAAKDQYERGIEEIKEFKDKDNSPSDQEKLLKNLPETFAVEIKQLFLSFYSNLSLISTKEESQLMTIHHCNGALLFDGSHFKCLYRRAVAYRVINDLEKAKDDLSKCLQIDSANNLVKKQLNEVTHLLKEQRKKDKNAFGSIFAGKKSMYDDREIERQQKVKEREENERKEKEEWQSSNKKRVDEGLTEETLEEWKTRVEEEKKDKKDKKDIDGSDKSAGGNKEKENREKERKIKTTPAKRKENNSSSEKDVDYDDEDAKIIAETKAKGYCYFKNDIKSEFCSFSYFTVSIISLGAEEELKAVNPKSLVGDENKSSPVTVPVFSAVSTSDKVEASSWNHAGKLRLVDSRKF